MITRLVPTERFARELRKLDPELTKKAKVALEKLLQSPVPKTLRHHTLSGYKPTVHVIDVCSNKSHQITFNLDGDVAVLLRIGTHKQISRDPE